MPDVSPSSEPIRFDQVLFNVRANTRRQALEMIAGVAARETGLDEAWLKERLWERDQQATSGIGDGVAIPHMKPRKLNAPYALVARLMTPVPFNAVDDMPVDLIILMLSPDSDGPLHLQRLSRISRMLRDESFRALLRGADSEDAMKAFLFEREDVQLAA